MSLELREQHGGLGPLFHTLSRRLLAGDGALIGETGVASLRVHLLENAADRLRILSLYDAGETFYNRAGPNEVLHVDVFHRPGVAHHWEVARAAVAAVEAYAREWHRPVSPDVIDVQTGTGGGRITGSLAYGRKSRLLESHRNHVHLAAGVDPDDFGLALYLVAFVEKELLRQGLGLGPRPSTLTDRRPGDRTLDLGEYTDRSDSRLVRPAETGRSAVRPASGRAGDTGSGPPHPERALLSGSDGALPAGRHTAHTQHPTLPQGEKVARDLAESRRQSEALLLSRLAGGPQELLLLLTGFAAGKPGGGPFTQQLSRDQGRDLLKELSAHGIVSPDRRALTAEGEALRRYLGQALHQVEWAFRSYTRQAGGGSGRPGQAGLLPRSRRERSARPLEPGQQVRELAAVETAVRRLGRRQKPLGRGDIYVHRRRYNPPLNICLLLDASASMAGPRVQATQDLVRHLLVNTRDRVAVMTFQERQAQVKVPFTRSHRLVEAGLVMTRTGGLTPLAEALYQARRYLLASGMHHPLLLLVTDGVPTVPRFSLNPLKDALNEAKSFRNLPISFACIGLEPNRSYLEELVQSAGGRLHVVQELEGPTLALIARQERMYLKKK